MEAFFICEPLSVMVNLLTHRTYLFEYRASVAW